MEKLNLRFETAEKALTRLHEVTAKNFLTDIERDGMIQRFEFCFEIIWKCGKDYLLKHEGLEAASPKKVIRLLREVGLLDDKETEKFLEMADDRNLTAHTYDEDLAEKMVLCIREYEPLMSELYKKMKNILEVEKND